MDKLIFGIVVGFALAVGIIANPKEVRHIREIEVKYMECVDSLKQCRKEKRPELQPGLELLKDEILNSRYPVKTKWQVE